MVVVLWLVLGLVFVCFGVEGVVGFCWVCIEY